MGQSLTSSSSRTAILTFAVWSVQSTFLGSTLSLNSLMLRHSPTAARSGELWDEMIPVITATTTTTTGIAMRSQTHLLRFARCTGTPGGGPNAPGG